MELKKIATLIAAIIAAANMALGMFGLPQLALDEDTIYSVLSVVAMVVAWGMSIWYNFPFTKAAKKGQMVIDAEKAGYSDDWSDDESNEDEEDGIEG